MKPLLFYRPFSSISNRIISNRMISLRGLPKKNRRYLNAAGGVSFIVAFLAAMDYFTSLQLRESTTYKHSIHVLKSNPQVIAKLGEPITEGWSVSSRRNKHSFLMEFNIKGPKGKAHINSVTATSTKNVQLIYLSMMKGNEKIVLVNEPHQLT